MAPYPRALLERFQAPRHRGRLGDSTHSGRASNPLCGDEMTVDAFVEDGHLRAVGFEGVGCAISLGAADILAERWRGMAVGDAAAMDLEAVQEEIGMEVAPGRRQCATLALEALRQAVTAR